MNEEPPPKPALYCRTRAARRCANSKLDIKCTVAPACGGRRTVLFGPTRDKHGMAVKHEVSLSSMGESRQAGKPVLFSACECLIASEALMWGRREGLVSCGSEERVQDLLMGKDGGTKYDLLRIGKTSHPFLGEPMEQVMLKRATVTARLTVSQTLQAPLWQ